MNSRHSSHYFAETLRDLYFQESSGLLEVSVRPGQDVRLHFDRGMLYFAESADPAARLDAMLVEAGILPEPTVRELLKSAPSTIGLAAAIASGKILDAGELDPIIRSLVRRCVSLAFTWPGGSATFRQAEPVAGFFAPDVLFTFECIIEGIRSMAHFGPLRDVLLKLPNRVRMGGRTFLPMEKLALRPHHGFVLSRVDGSTCLEEIALLVPGGEEDEAIQFLYGLAVLGILEFDPPTGQGLFSLKQVMKDQHLANVREEEEISLVKETAARIMAQTPEQILGIEPDAPLPSARQAFERLKKEFHRSRFSDRVREQVKKDLTLIENKVAEAFLTLQVQQLERNDPSSRLDDHRLEINTEHVGARREMSRSEAQEAEALNKEIAEKYFVKAREYYHEKDFFNVIEFCKLALKFGMNTPQVQLLMAMAYGKNPNSRWQRLAEMAYVAACDLDPWNADYRVALAAFYQERGLDIRARKQYEKALEIMPSHSAAQAGMRRKGRR